MRFHFRDRNQKTFWWALALVSVSIHYIFRNCSTHRVRYKLSSFCSGFLQVTSVTDDVYDWPLPNKILGCVASYKLLFSDKRKIVYIQFDLIERSLQFRTWFHPLQHFSLVKLGILLVKLLCWKFFSEKNQVYPFKKKNKKQSNSWALCLVTWQMIRPKLPVKALHLSAWLLSIRIS